MAYQFFNQFFGLKLWLGWVDILAKLPKKINKLANLRLYSNIDVGDNFTAVLYFFPVVSLFWNPRVRTFFPIRLYQSRLVDQALVDVEGCHVVDNDRTPIRRIIPQVRPSPEAWWPFSCITYRLRNIAYSFKR